LVFGLIWIALLICLAVKELTSIIGSERGLRLGRTLSKPILPLLFIFILLVVLSVVNVLQSDNLERVLYP
jgi:hypothetical protein